MEQQITISHNEPDINANENPAPVSDAMFRVLTEAAASAILIYQEDVFRYLNHAIEVISGYSRQELFAMSTWDIVHPEDLEMVMGRANARLRGEDVPSRYEFRIRSKTGETRWIDFTASLVIFNGKPAVLGTAFDTTERKKTEEALNQSENALRRRAEELAALSAFSLDIAEPLDLKSLENRIVQRSLEMLKAKGGALALCDPEKGEIYVACEHFPASEGYQNITFKYGEGAAGRVAQTGIPIIIEDYRSWPGRAQAYEAIQPYTAVLSVPLNCRGRVIGVLQVMDDHEKRSFTQADQELLSLLANHAGIAIENVRLIEAEHTAYQRSEAVRQASLSLTSSLELPEVLEAILESVLNLLPEVNNSNIYLYEQENGGTLTFGAILWEDGRRDKPLVDPRPQGLTHTVARSGEAMVISDIREHPFFGNAPLDLRGAVAGLPLKIGQRVVGVMNISYREPRLISMNELQLLRTLADQAAIAIENARLYSRAATEQRHISLLYDLGRELARSLDPTEILDKAISLTCQALNGFVGQAFMLNADEDRLVLSATYGRQLSRTSPIRVQIGEGLAGWVGLTKEPANVPNVSDQEHWLDIPGIDDDVRSAISAPILVGNRLLGVLSVLHNQIGGFSSNHLTLLEAICQEVGLALSNATRYRQVERQLKEITFIQTLAQTFNRRLKLEELLNEVVSQLAGRLNYPLVEIFLIEGEMLVQRAANGVPATADQIPLTQGVIGRVARTGIPALVPDVTQEPAYLSTFEDTISELAVPIFHGSVVVGVINIESNIPDQITYQDRDLVEVLAGQISIALENAVLYDRLSQHATDLEQLVNERTAELVELYELSEKIGYTLSTGEIIQLLLSHLRNAIRSDLVVGGLVMDNQRLLFVETVRPILPATMVQLQAYWLDILTKNGLPTEDFENIPIEVNSSASFDPGKPPLKQIQSYIYAPIVIEGVIVGLLIAGSEKDNAFGEAQARLVDTFANQGAAAIQRLAGMLAAEQKRLEGLVEHLPIGVLLIDSDYRLLMANPLGKELLGAINGSISESHLGYLGSQSVAELIRNRYDQMPVEIIKNGSAKRIFVAQAQPAGEDSDLWVLTLREVTQEREYQTRIQMQERLATVGQLAAGIAHDFNNIMAAILVYTDLLSNDPEIPPTSRDRLKIIEQQVQRAASLIRQILDFSRRSVMEQSDLDLLPFVKELDKMLRRVLPETIQLELSYRTGNYLVHADPTRLQQAIMNLALNARDAMPDGGLLHFELNRIMVTPNQKPPIADMRPGEWVRIIVKDMGVGIRTDHLPRIFEPFFTTKPVGQGTGLGLAQVYGIIKQHDGFIDVKTKVGHGTSFTIYLPALDEPKIQVEAPETRVRLNGVGKIVLVVEDDPATREALQALLEAHKYQVETARNGLEAMQIIETTSRAIDLVVSDVVMPLMGGVALYKNIRERWPGLKVLLVTGHPLDGENQDMLEKGKVNWLQKPFSAQAFNQAVFALLQE